MFDWLMVKVVTWWNSQSTFDIYMHVMGFVGQMLFFSRWIVQLFVSERAKKIIVPTVFWLLSLVGAVITLIYAIYLVAPAFILAQTFGMIVYFWNLTIVGREKRTQQQQEMVAAE